jgi:hypothetical protein
MPILERTKLYKDVWSRPCTKIAADLGDFQQRVEADLHRDGYSDAGGGVLDADAVRQEGFCQAASPHLSVKG